MYFEIVGEVTHVETFAVASSIKEIARLRKLYGRGRWRKRKGIARVESSTSQAKTTYIHKLSSRRLNSHNLYAEPFWLPSNRPVNADARTTVVFCKGRFARGYCER